MGISVFRPVDNDDVAARNLDPIMTASIGVGRRNYGKRLPRNVASVPVKGSMGTAARLRSRRSVRARHDSAITSARTVTCCSGEQPALMIF